MALILLAALSSPMAMECELDMAEVLAAILVAALGSAKTMKLEWDRVVV